MFTRTTAIESHDVAAQRPTFELAYLGDAFYELWSRHSVLALRRKPDNVNKEVFRWVRCQTQAAIVNALLPHLNATELHVYQRGKNNKPRSRPKHATVQEYRDATAFECLVGFWYLADPPRFEQMMARAEVRSILLACTYLA